MANSRNTINPRTDRRINSKGDSEGSLSGCNEKACQKYIWDHTDIYKLNKYRQDEYVLLDGNNTEIIKDWFEAKRSFPCWNNKEKEWEIEDPPPNERNRSKARPDFVFGKKIEINETENSGNKQPSDSKGVSKATDASQNIESSLSDGNKPEDKRNPPPSKNVEELGKGVETLSLEENSGNQGPSGSKKAPKATDASQQVKSSSSDKSQSKNEYVVWEVKKAWKNQKTNNFRYHKTVKSGEIKISPGEVLVEKGDPDYPRNYDKYKGYIIVEAKDLTILKNTALDQAKIYGQLLHRYLPENSKIFYRAVVFVLPEKNRCKIDSLLFVGDENDNAISLST